MMFKKLITVGMLVSLSIAGFVVLIKSATSKQSGATPGITLSVQSDKVVADTSKQMTFSDVTFHNNKSDCWMVIDEVVYDVTKFIAKHPGGSRIIQGCGKDASTLFKGAGGHIHSQLASALLKSYQIGRL